MKNKPDFLLLGAFVVLVLWGFFSMTLVSFPFSLEKFGTSWHYVWHQLFLGLLPGILLAFVIFKTDLEVLKKISPWLLGLNLLLLLLLFIPGISPEIKGSNRWLNLGAFSIQPSEFLKITFLVYLSAWLSNRTFFSKKGSDKKGSKKNFVRTKINWQAPFVFLTVLFILGIALVLQPDLSTLAIIFLASLSIYFISPAPWWHSFLMLLAGGGLTALFIKITPYRMSRVLAMLNPQIDPLGASYQLKQSFIAIGSGKLTGIGQGFALGLSRQKFGFLPEPMTDSIFAIIGEELGLLGALSLLLLFLFFLWRGLKITFGLPSEFRKLLAVGITVWISLQAFFNIGGIVGILPIAGIPLPFFSYGASHLITEMIGVGILLNISKTSCKL